MSKTSANEDILERLSVFMDMIHEGFIGINKRFNGVDVRLNTIEGKHDTVESALQLVKSTVERHGSEFMKIHAAIDYISGQQKILRYH